MNSIGKKIRLIRLSKSLSQENMAELLKMSSTGYSKIERGLTDVNYSRLEKIAKVFKMEVSEIVQYGEEEIKSSRHKTSSLDILEAKEKEIVYLKKIIQLLEDKLSKAKK